MSASLQVFQDHYASLVQSLPLNDATFIAKLHSKRLLPGDIKAKLKTLGTPAEKATEFLDQVIEPFLKNNDVTPLKKLLTVMEDSGLKRLTKTIRSELLRHGSCDASHHSSDEPVATERGRKRTKSKKGGTKRKKRSVSTQSVNHSSTDDSSDEPVATKRGRKKTKSKKGGTKRRKRSVSTDPMIDWLGDFMKGRYCNMRLKKRKEENDPWPPVKTKGYITLTLMYQKDLQTRAETTQTIFLRTKGDISAIPKKANSQKLTDITQIFSSQSGSIPNSILIEGHPGMGKTTLVKKICVEWAEGKLLTSDKLVLLLLLRDPNVQSITNVQQLIEHFTQSTSKVTQLHSYLEDNHGADVTLIIDGFDELSNELREESFFINLIEKNILPEARIVVTSRPNASACLHHIVDKRIEILGFDESNRIQYIHEALQGSPSKLKKLQKHFQQYPNIDAICYIPLIMSIIVFLCMCQPENLPPTASKMYYSFVLHTICHYLKRTGKIAEDERINKMEHLPQPVQQELQQLQKVAFDGLVEDKIVFTMDDLPDMCRDNPTCYGLLQSVECYCSDEIGTPTKSFNFLHLGIQEYFAAKYVVTLPEDEVYTLMKESFLATDRYRHPDSESVRLSNMWIMYCGITSGQCNSLRQYLSSWSSQSYDHCWDDDYSPPNSSPSFSYNITDSCNDDYYGTECNDESFPLMKHHNVHHSYQQKQQQQLGYHSVTISRNILKDPVKVLYLFQCFQEAQDDKLCDILSESFNSGEIDLSHHSLLPHQVMSLGFFLSRSHRKWNKLNLFDCDIGDYGINLLHHYLCGDKTNKQEITTIDLSDNYLTGASSPLIGDIIIHLQPHTLMLSDSNITSVRDISTAVINTNTVKVLYMGSNGFTLQEASAISDMITCLEELHIGYKLGDDGAVIISKRITKTNTLRVLGICNNNITSTGATEIAYSLLHNTSLEELDISKNPIGKDGATAIAQAITNNKTLKKLYLYGDTIDEQSAMIIMRSLHHNNSITKLKLPNKLEYNENVKREAKHINSTRRKCNIQKLEVYFC
ncbi:protein NLRC3-like isoform X2 [Dysidea avara]|uniref:protein NLRC3-like isoform X2 n=1 Tax=Dysidea avara TaxID=196820 RepID=UPI00332AFB68